MKDSVILARLRNSLLPKSFPLRIGPTGKVTMNKTHEYYAQVQMQLLVTRRSYAIFTMYTFKEQIHVYVRPDQSFFNVICAKSSLYFRDIILPEAVAKFWSHNYDQASTKPLNLVDVSNAINLTNSAPLDTAQSNSVAQTQSTTTSNFMPCVTSCTTNVFDVDDVIFCANESCRVKQFHKKCVGVRKPRTTWKCTECRKAITSAKAKLKRLQSKQLNKENRA